MDNLKYRNTEGLLQFIDVSAEDFCDDQMPVSKQEMMDIIHARTVNGDIVSGVEVFQLAYGAVISMGDSADQTPVIKQICDWVYPHIARTAIASQIVSLGSCSKIARDRAAARLRKIAANATINNAHVKTLMLVFLRY